MKHTSQVMLNTSWRKTQVRISVSTGTSCRYMTVKLSTLVINVFLQNSTVMKQQTPPKRSNLSKGAFQFISINYTPIKCNPLLNSIITIQMSHVSVSVTLIVVKTCWGETQFISEVII